MGRKPKPVNEHFFDEESKEMWYVLGISYANYFQHTIRGIYPSNVWQSTSKPLVEIVKSCLGSEQTISNWTYKNIREDGEDFTTHKLKIENQEIYDGLAERGLDAPKRDRKFPKDVGVHYLGHFIRGFFDARVSCVEYRGGPRLKVSYSYNLQFLQSLYSALVEHANVKGGRKITKSPLVLSGQNAIATHDFMYRDWSYIEERGLYLPSKKERFGI